MGLKCNCRTIVAVIFYVLGIVFFVTGCVLLFGEILQNMIDQKVDENIELKNGTLVFKQWRKQTSPIYMQYFVFDLQNPAEVMNGSELPYVIERGPYSYKEIRRVDILHYSADKSIVTFMPNRTFIFDPETSCKGCNDTTDTFTNVNIPLLTLALWLKTTDYKSKHSICFQGVEVILLKNKAALFQAKTVYEILWGYVDPVLNDINDVPSIFCPKKEGLDPFIQLQYNNTYYGISAINTGIKEINKLEQYEMWRNRPNLTWWESDYANMLNGTDGTQFKPRISKSDTLYTFVPEICRSIYSVYDSTVTVRDIKLYRFTAPSVVYLSGDIYPPNMGFCVPPGCLPTGLLNLTRCQPQNPPVAVSPPHFYQSNSSLVKAVRGMHPVKSEHATFIDIEPITGITMQANKRIQINVALEPVSILSQTSGSFAPVFLPMMYVNESALISEADAKTFRDKVYGPIDLAHGAEYGLVAVGGFFILVASIVLVLECLRTNDDDTDKSKLVQD
ncbi:lysosome membrane protein 2 isoform X2 [Nematostella vectensis]|uniref:lysosome membrane protein 2 isoform X2 n=1 Tax=Nematostella vectensis TaxID=45351 RepID=UPI0020773B67|nr:lysosome membrane protein 2 isoform X2 [Nematostella vectensis]XP_048589818.1 lysosome membrane protein 2 isoform X2 [Nematostella vectensis]